MCVFARQGAAALNHEAIPAKRIGMPLTPSGRLLLVRHGESEGNATRTFTPDTEVPLTDVGRDQARRAAEVLRAQFAPVAVVASPYARARVTGEIIAAALALEVRIEPDFREQWLGDLRGQPYDVVRRDPAFDPRRRWEWRPPGGESLVDVQRRVAPALERLAQDHAVGDVVLVSHGGVMLALWAHFVGSWEKAHPAGNAAIVLVEHDGRRFGPPSFVHPGGIGGEAATLDTGG
jgi:broad specificity phosphatase PhoE